MTDKNIKLVNLLKNVEFSLILQIQQQKENQIHRTEGAKSAVGELKCSTGPTEVTFWLLKAAKVYKEGYQFCHRHAGSA